MADKEKNRYNRHFKTGYLRGGIETNSTRSRGYGYFDTRALEEASAKIEKDKGRYNPHSDPQSKGYALSIANRLLNLGVKTGTGWEAVEGALIYEQMGYGKRPSVKRRLLKAFEKSSRKEFDESLYEQISGFIKRNQQVKSNSLERVAAAAAVICLTSGLAFASPRITGNAIYGLTTGYSSVVGAVLILLGLITGYIWVKEKKQN